MMKMQIIIMYINLDANYIMRIFKNQKVIFLIIIIHMAEIRQYLFLIIMTR